MIENVDLISLEFEGKLYENMLLCYFEKDIF